jgi:hypothetical protein
MILLTSNLHPTRTVLFTTVINSLKATLYLNYTEIFSSKRDVNTLRLGYKSQSINDALREKIAACSEIH